MEVPVAIFLASGRHLLTTLHYWKKKKTDSHAFQMKIQSKWFFKGVKLNM